MAIISCEKCGKKYSNTVSACIECGNPTPSFIDSTLGNTTDANSNSEGEKYIDYFTLPGEYMMELDDEFILQNEWALKFEQKKRANRFFRKACTTVMGCSFLLFMFLIYGTHLIQNYAISDEVFWGAIIAFGVGLIGAIAFGIRGLTMSFGKAGLKWDEMRNEWLKREKNIIVGEQGGKS